MKLLKIFEFFKKEESIETIWEGVKILLVCLFIAHMFDILLFLDWVFPRNRRLIFTLAVIIFNIIRIGLTTAYWLSLNAPVVGTAWGVVFHEYFHYSIHRVGYWLIIFRPDPVWFLSWYWNFGFKIVLPQIYEDVRRDIAFFLHSLFHDYIYADTWEEKFYATIKIFCYILFNIIFVIILLTNFFWGDDIFNFLVFAKDSLVNLFLLVVKFIKDLFN